MINLAVTEFYVKMTIDGESYDPFSAETLKVLPPTHPSFRNEIINASRRKFSISKDAAAKLIAEEEATIIRSAEEKAIIEGRTKKKTKEKGEEVEEGGDESPDDKSGSRPKSVGTSQEAEPMI